MHETTERAPKAVYERATFIRDLLQRGKTDLQEIRARMIELLDGKKPRHMGLTAGPGDNLPARLALNLAKLELRREVLALCPMTGDTLVYSTGVKARACPRCQKTEGDGVRFGTRMRGGVQKPQALCSACRNTPPERPKKRTVFTHANCADGNACYAMFRLSGFADEIISLTLPVKASVDKHGKIRVLEKSTGRTWCVPRAVFADLTPTFEDTGHIPRQGAIVVLDHHEGGRADADAIRNQVPDAAGKSQIVLDTSECGASLTCKWISWVKSKAKTFQRVFVPSKVQVPADHEGLIHLIRVADLDLKDDPHYEDALSLAVFGRARANYEGLFETPGAPSFGVARGRQMQQEQQAAVEAAAAECFVFHTEDPEGGRILIYTDVPRKALIQPLYTYESGRDEIKSQDLAVFVCREAGSEGLSFRGTKALPAAAMLGGGGHMRAAQVSLGTLRELALNENDPQGTRLPLVWNGGLSEEDAAHLIFETIKSIF